MFSLVLLVVGVVGVAHEPLFKREMRLYPGVNLSRTMLVLGPIVAAGQFRVQLVQTVEEILVLESTWSTPITYSSLHSKCGAN